MPTIDVSGLLYDPEVAGDHFTVSRKSVVVNPASGLAEEVSVRGFPSCQIGAVYPSGGSKVVRTAEGENVQADITILTQFRLEQGNGSTLAPDVVSWAGTDYTVINVNDYSRYGGGLYEAMCVKKTLG